MSRSINAPDRTVRRPGRLTNRHHPAPAPAVPVDIYQCDDHYVVLCDLPGMDPGSLGVEVDGTTITIRGHRGAPHTTTSSSTFSTSRAAGSRTST
jgi:HSP20 family molecular chaperone IbpA